MESTDLIEHIRSKIRIYEDRKASTVSYMSARAGSQDWESVMRLSAELLNIEALLRSYKEELENLNFK